MGEPGTEQFIMDKTGNIQLRQLLDEPSGLGRPVQRRRWLIPASTLALGVVLALSVGGLYFAGFLGENGGGPAQEPGPSVAFGTAASGPATSDPVARTFFTEGVGFYEQGDFQQAVGSFDQVIDLAPEATGGYYNRGLAHGGLEEYQQAVDDFSRAISLDPQYPQAYFNRATAYGFMGRDSEAQEDLTRATELRSRR